MRHFYYNFSLVALVLLLSQVNQVNAQDAPHSDALEDLMIEYYYISDAQDATDTDGGALADSSVTYRLFVNLKEGYNLQAVYGDEEHALTISTSTEFFNNEDRGETTGESIGANRLEDNTVALDSYLSVGGASSEHFGIPKFEDIDGSIIAGDNSDGGSEGIAGGLLVNDNPCAGTALTLADGLMAKDTIPEVTFVGITPDMFGDENSEVELNTNNGSWASLDFTTGATQTNTILIAQLTTNGTLSFNLNLQIGISGEKACELCDKPCTAGNPVCPQVVQFVHTFVPEADTADDLNVYRYGNEELSWTSPSLANCIPTATDETFNSLNMNLFPNPASEFVTLELPKADFSYGFYAVRDLTGKARVSGSLSNGNHTQQVLTTNLEPGIYLVEVRMDDITSTRKLVVE